MSRPTRATPGGRAYLDLQNRARRERRGTQELLVLYAIERWLARLAASPYAETFVLKGGMLLAVFDARRPTMDADLLARQLANEASVVLARVKEIASIRLEDDGVEFLLDTMTAKSIRDGAIYTGVRISLDCHISTAQVKVTLDINFGDPITPAPLRVDLPSQRPGLVPVSLWGYPIETVVAEKACTAVELREANTRVRDYADLYSLIGKHSFSYADMRAALEATAAYRRQNLVPLSRVVGALAAMRQDAYSAFRNRLGGDGEHLPSDLATVVTAVVAFLDPARG